MIKEERLTYVEGKPFSYIENVRGDGELDLEPGDTIVRNDGENYRIYATCCYLVFYIYSARLPSPKGFQLTMITREELLESYTWAAKN